MKILIISNMYPSKQKPYSGIFVKNQYEYLKDKLNQNIEIYAMQRELTSKVGSIIKYIKFYIKFISYLKNRYEIIHIHFFGYHTFLAYLYKFFYPKTKIMVTFHGGDTKNINKNLFKFLLKKIDLLVAVGSEQYEYISKNTNNMNIKKLSAGIDSNIFFKQNITKQYDFIFVGSFYSIKGVDILCSAIELLDKNIKYCFVGSGDYESTILKLKEKYNVELFKNKTQKEIAILLSASKYLVLPSRGDSFGLVVSEAIFCGTPAIVSNIGGMKDQVKDNYNGFIVKENNPQELAKTLKKALSLSEEEYLKMSENAEKSNKEYSLENVCNKLNSIYKELVNEN